jgi:alanyl-tRNA synthetase
MSATTTEPVTEPTAAPPTDETPEDDAYDKPRAMATIAKLRPFQDEAKRLRKELDDLRANEDKAKEDALAEQAQFKQLADKRADKIVELEAKVATIETLQQERDRLANVVDDLVKQQRDGLPEWVIELLDGKDAIGQLAWMSKNRETVTGANGGPTVGIAGVPRPAGNLSREQLIEQEKQRLRGSGRYG